MSKGADTARAKVAEQTLREVSKVLRETVNKELQGTADHLDNVADEILEEIESMKAKKS